jgi:cyclopropane-fatty-acyl-phospholipid synthase
MFRNGEHERASGTSGVNGASGASGAAGTFTVSDTEPRRASEIVAPVVHDLLKGPSPVQFRFWDGSVLGDRNGPGSVVFHSPDALRRILWSPNELGLARAYVAGDVEIIDELPAVLRAFQGGTPSDIDFGIQSLPKIARAAKKLGALGTPLPPPSEEMIPQGVLHSRKRDAQAVRHHYDVSNDFYRLLLGPSFTYSCARFVTPETTLEQAQTAKHDLVCRKLALHTRPAMRLLDVGCGWGSMALHAAKRYGAKVLGVTLSEEQAREAQRRIHEAQMDSLIEIRVQDYRDLAGEQFDAISSIGMFEHVGRKETDRYFARLRALLVDGGRLLNHAISSPNGSRLSNKSFMYRYVFPDGELLNVGDTILAMQSAGFEARDMESLREHYERTLRHWLTNLEANLDEAVKLVGERRTRIWRLYISGCINGFNDGGISIHQVLGVVPDSNGQSFMPATRTEWEVDPICLHTADHNQGSAA